MYARPLEPVSLKWNSIHMSKSIKYRAIRGIAWSAVEKFSRQGLMTFFAIVIARQLTPADYGLVAMLNIFLVLAQIFVDSGFVEALIQKQNRTEVDFSTTFWFNIGVALLIYALLVLASPLIAGFYHEPLLEDIVIWMGLIFVINAFRTVQQAKLNIAMDFRRQAWISIVAISVSGGFGLWMAGHGFGVWTLVWQPLIQNFLNVVLLWFSAGWIPSFLFSRRSFNELFGFGSKLLLSRTLHGVYTNGSFLLIGKFFSPTATGLYSQSFLMTSFIPTSINDIVVRVAYPIECELQNNDEELQRFFYQILRMTCFFLFPLMMGMAALAEPLVRLFLTEKWIDIVPFIQILCFVWIWSPASNMCWQLLNAKHRGDYSLKSEIIKKFIAVLILIISIFFNLTTVCIGVLIYFIMDVYVMTQFTRRVLPKVTFRGEIRVLFPIFLRAVVMGIIVYMLKYIIVSDILLLIVGPIVGVISYTIITFLSTSKEAECLLSIFKKMRCSKSML